jgi:hypothetical protein
LVFSDLAAGFTILLKAPGRSRNICVPELETFHWFFDDFKFKGEAKTWLGDYCLACLEEVAGERDFALKSFKALRTKLSENYLLIDKTDRAISRLSRRAGE